MTALSALPLAFAAGALTILSPCVLPLAPIVVAGGRAKGVGGPLALAGGLALTFGVAGGLLASAGVAFGDAPALRIAAGALMVAAGAALLVPRLKLAVETGLAPTARIAEALRERLPKAGLLGEAAAGAALAFAWAPCAGPTLGAAFALAAGGGSLGLAMLTMTAYGFGAAISLIALGALLGRLAARSRWIAHAAGAAGQAAFGALIALVGALVVTGLDHHIEASLVAAMPDWLTAFATRL